MKTRTHYLGLPLLILGLLIASGCSNTTPESENDKEDDKGMDAGAGSVAGASAGTRQANRGEFGPESCPVEERVAVDPSAAFAVFLDANGEVVGDRAEDLNGTEGNQMCPTPKPSGPGACPAGTCAKTISGRKICLPC